MKYTIPSTSLEHHLLNHLNHEKFNERIKSKGKTEQFSLVALYIVHIIIIIKRQVHFCIIFCSSFKYEEYSLNFINLNSQGKMKIFQPVDAIEFLNNTTSICILIYKSQLRNELR